MDLIRINDTMIIHKKNIKNHKTYKTIEKEMTL